LVKFWAEEAALDAPEFEHADPLDSGLAPVTASWSCRRPTLWRPSWRTAKPVRIVDEDGRGERDAPEHHLCTAGRDRVAASRRYDLGMRLIVARCEVRYSGRVTAVLPMALRLLMVKSDGSVMVHADTGGYKPQNCD
jgi:hypothetical protein